MDSNYSRYLLYGAAGVAAVLWLRKGATKSKQAKTNFESFLKAPVVVEKKSKIASTSFAAFLHVQPEQTCSTDFASFLKDRNTGAQATASEDAAIDVAADPIPETAIPIVVLYGTEYGFAREISEKLCQQLKDTGKYWPILVNSADQADGYDLANQQAVFMVFSTQGDGVPPSESRDFCEWLFAGKAGPLPDLHYSVCALGDTTYTHFCRCGRQVDDALASAGALQLVPRVDVDKEDWRKVDAWIAGVISGLAGLSNLQSFADLGGVSAAGVDCSTANNSNSTKKYSKSKPYYARVVAVEGLCVLSNPDDKDTVRLELELSCDAVEAGGLSYLPGDALGIWPTNPPQVVDELLQQLGASGAERVPRPAWHYMEHPDHSREAADSSNSDNTISIRHALSVCYDIKTPKAPQLLQMIQQQLLSLEQQLLKQGSKRGGRVSIDIRADAATAAAGLDCTAVSDTQAAQDSSSIGPEKQAVQLSAAVARIQALLSDGSELESYLAARHVTDILQDFPAAVVTLEQLVSVLRPLQPRLYSISSSPLEHNPANSGVQATIAVVRYESLGKARQGVCSTQVGERLQSGMYLPVFISKNPDFRLPDDPSTPIIMVGPGTGLAPFRAFILQRILQHQQQQQQHDTSSATAAALGPMHLFFGCRRRDQDYLYGEQLQQWHDSGAITLHTAFSREGRNKVYVQQRLREAADVVWDLLEAGGHFYVCGDAGSMAGAVEAALLGIIQQHQQNGTEATARGYLNQLAAAGRYERDVWF